MQYAAMPPATQRRDGLWCSRIRQNSGVPEGPLKSGDISSSTLPAIADDFGIVSTAPVFGGTGYRDVVSGRGSTDGTFGSLDSPAANFTTDSADGALRIQPGTLVQTLELLIENDSSEDLDFEMLYFDIGNTDRAFAEFAISFENLTTGDTEDDIADGTIDSNGATGNTDDYVDFDFNISGVSLPSGESGRFNFIFLGNSPSSTHLDNVLVTVATAVPEPSSFALLGMLGLGLATRRRR